MNDEKQFDSYIVAHQCCGQQIANTFTTYPNAEAWCRFLLTLDRIDSAEIIGVVKNEHLLKRFEREDKNDN